MNSAERVPIREWNLGRLDWTTSVHLPEALLNQTSIERIRDVVNGRMVYMLRTAIYTQRLDGQVVRYPADWWQAFKRRFFPRWALNRWPVLETIKTMRLHAWYPDLLIPGKRAQFLIQVLDGEQIP